MANVKYKDQVFPEASPIAGEKLSANGVYTGQHKGTPMQGHGETAANADPYHVAHGIIRQGTIMQDAGDSNFPVRCFTITYDLNGGSGTVPDAQQQGFNGGALTLATFPATAVVPKYFEKDTDGTPADTSLLVVADTKTPEDGEIRLSDVTPAKSTYTPVVGDYVKQTAYSAFFKWNTKADGTGTAYAAEASLTPAADVKLFAIYTE